MCQMNSSENRLVAPHGDEGGVAREWKVDAVNLFKAGKVKEARQLMCASVRPEEMEDVFRWMYDNIALWSEDEFKQDRAILAIRQGLVNHSFVADPEINLSATLIELANL